MIEIKSDKIITPEGLQSGYLYLDNELIDGFFEKEEPPIKVTTSRANTFRRVL